MHSGLLERLSHGETLICGEGYIFELERRGYLSIGSYVPVVVLDHPHVVRTLHEEYVRAGTDIVEAITVSACHWLLGFPSCVMLLVAVLWGSVALEADWSGGRPGVVEPPGVTYCSGCSPQAWPAVCRRHL